MLPTDPHEDWLQMPADQGERRFGPLPDRVRIGSDPSCDIVLAPHLGLPPVAIELRRNERRAWTVEHASQPPWPCEIARPQNPDEPPVPGRPVRSGSRFAPGEAVVLSAIGAMPRFVLLRTSLVGPDPLADEENDADEVEARILRRQRRTAQPDDHVPGADDPPEAQGAGVAPRLGRAGSFGNAIASEAVRQAGARVLAGNSTAQQLDRFGRLTRQGAWTSPYMLVAAGLALLTLMAGGVATWTGWFSRMWSSW